MVDPVQNLGDSFICSIEKVFLCTGTDGYVPKYNPSNFEFGCLADAPSLLYRFKIIVSNTRVCIVMVIHLVVTTHLVSIQTFVFNLLTIGQGPAGDSGQVIWQRSFQSLPGSG